MSDFFKMMAKDKAEELSKKYGFDVYIDPDNGQNKSKYFLPEVTIGNVTYIGQSEWTDDEQPPYALRPAGQKMTFSGHDLEELKLIYNAGNLGDLEALYEELTLVLTQLIEFPVYDD